jgi:2-dehydropantoate 2-reductase
MQEAQEIAEKLGIEFRHTIDKRIDGAEAVGAHKTSMLQDVEARRKLEVEALIGAVIELGRLTDTPSPSIDAVYACVKGLDKTLTQD